GIGTPKEREACPPVHLDPCRRWWDDSEAGYSTSPERLVSTLGALEPSTPQACTSLLNASQMPTSLKRDTGSWAMPCKLMHIARAGGKIMRLRFLGKGGSKVGDCPTLFATDRDTYLVQGWRTASPDAVEIPHLLLGFAEPDTFIGAALADTGRGTFTLSGRPIDDHETLNQLTMEAFEAAIEVPMNRRAFYGGAAAE
ncbi:hypothetical protein, partial [Nocardia sp. NPDC004722]